MKRTIFLILILCFPLVCFGIDYEITGTDSDGNTVSGKVDVDQWDGKGYIYSEKELGGKKVYVEWSEEGKLRGYDEYGQTYNFDFK